VDYILDHQLYVHWPVNSSFAALLKVPTSLTVININIGIIICIVFRKNWIIVRVIQAYRLNVDTFGFGQYFCGRNI
jgi:hypothetical protein